MTTATEHGLLTLPRELRDIIYTHVLAPTGYIEFYLRQNTNRRLRIRPSNPPMTVPYTATWPDITLGLLGTSKQIRDEAKIVFWRTNQFKLMCRSWNYFGSQRSFEPPHCTYAGLIELWQHIWMENLVHAQIYFSFVLSEQLEMMLKIMEKCKNLKSLTLRDGFECRKRRRVWIEGDKLRNLIYEWDLSRSRYRKAASDFRRAVEGENSVLPMVDKKLIFDGDFGMLEIPKRERRYFEERYKVKPDWKLAELPIILSHLHLSLGTTNNELWLGKTLLIKDGSIPDDPPVPAPKWLRGLD